MSNKYQRTFENALNALSFIKKSKSEEKSTELDEKKLDLERQKLELIKEQNKNDAERQKTLDDLQVLSKRVAEKQTNLLQDQQTWLEYKGRIDTLNEFIGGKKDITPAQMESMIKFMQPAKDKFNLDISPFFTPENEDKTKFAFNTGGALEKEYKNITDRLNAQANQTKAAQSLIQTQIDKLRLEKSDIPKTDQAAVIDQLYNDKKFKNLPIDERLKRIDEEIWKLPTSSTQVKSPIESGTKKELEDNMKAMTNQVSDLNIIAETFMPKYLTWPGKIKNFSIDKVLKAGTTAENIFNLDESDREYARNFTRFLNANMRIINKYTNEISGAQFSIKEIERYEKSLMNTKQNYEAYMASYNDMINFVKRGYRIAQYAIDKGYSGEKLQSEINRLIELHSTNPMSDPTLNNDYVEEMGNKLLTSYKAQNPNATEQQAMDWATMQLYERGYIR